MHCHDHDSWNGLFSGSSGSAHAGAGVYSRGLGVFSAAALPGSAAAAGPFLHGSALGADLFRAEPRFLLVSNDLARVTAKFLCALLPHLSPPRAEQFVAPLNAYLMKYQINTVQRIAAFLGQVAVESSQFRKLVESTWYRDAKHLKATFPTAFKTVDAAAYTRHPEKLANFVYAGRNGNGDEKSGDGWKYRGRGLIQLTFRDNYAAFAKDTGVDALNHPELLEQPKIAVYSAAWFWDRAHLNPFADHGSYKNLTLIINAKALGYNEREHYRKRAVTLLTRYPWDNLPGLC